MKKNFILLLTCAVVVLPLSAQENNDETGTDSTAIERTSDLNQKFSDVVTSNVEGSNIEGNYNNGLLITILIVSLISLIVSVLSIIQNRKKMTEKDVNPSKVIERQLSNMQQQLLQMRKLMEEMLAKQSSLLGEFVAKLGTVQQIPVEQPVQQPHPQPLHQPISASRQPNQTRQQRQAETSQKRVEAPIQEHIIYVRPSVEGTNVVLTPVSEAYADRATFVIKARGDKGTYSFNKAATKSVISYLDNMLTPYCDCSLLTNGTVSTINPTGDGTVEMQGEKWVVINKAQVSVS